MSRKSIVERKGSPCDAVEVREGIALRGDPPQRDGRAEGKGGVGDRCGEIGGLAGRRNNVPLEVDRKNHRMGKKKHGQWKRKGCRRDERRVRVSARLGAKISVDCGRQIRFRGRARESSQRHKRIP